MLAPILAAALATTPQPSTPSARLTVDPCRGVTVHTATPPPMRGRRLGELPPGVIQLAVDKSVGGCSVTVLPTRDAQGNHHMIRRGRDVSLKPVDGVSDRQRRPDRGR